ncbi:thiol:disulfide interchange protein precursor [Rhodotorula toruloides ATCC 204091]|nr:thiol:disulfide interchange protein precursor [Rhodotorula toruloides ATCC 204091]
MRARGDEGKGARSAHSSGLSSNEGDCLYLTLAAYCFPFAVTANPHSPATTAMPAHPAPPPLSAVAARRAAREAASAKQEQVHTSQSERGKLAGGAERQEDAMDDEGMASDASSESSTSEAEVARMLADEKRTQNSRTGKGKATTRYFAAESSRNEEEQDGDEVMAVDGGDLSPPEGLEDAGVAPTASASGYSTPNRNRRRRERTAFVDPYCVSSFALDEGVNAFQVQVAGEDGVERKAVVYALKADEVRPILITDLQTGVEGIERVFGAAGLGCGVGLFRRRDAERERERTEGVQDGKTWELVSLRLCLFISLRIFLVLLDGISCVRFRFGSVSSMGLMRDISSLLGASIAKVKSPPPPTSAAGIYRFAHRILEGGPSACHLTGHPASACARVIITRVLCARATARAPAARYLDDSDDREKRRMPKTCSARSPLDARGERPVREPSPSLAGLREVEAWTSAFSSTLPPSPRTFSAPNGVSTSDRLVAVVEGPKRVGKSTFAKMLVNQLLERYEKVAYLDTDLGQPEFTPPGFVSLSVVNEPILAPAFTHLSQPLSSHYLGSTSPASDPSGYLAAISALLSTYALEVEYPSLDEASSSRRHRRGQPADESNRADSSRKYRERVPLVINTQGWVKGLGADLLAKLKAESQPSHIFSFVETVENGASASDYAAPAQPTYSIMPPSADAPYFLASLPPAPPSPLESKWSAVDLRTLSLISYFHSVQSARSPAWDFTTPLVGVAPYEFDWRAERRQVAQVHVMEGADVAYEHALHALNGSVVALVQEASPAASATSRPFPYDPSAPLPFPSTSRALGLAVVHSISPATSTLHLLTPVLASVLASSAPISLVKGSLDLPIALMLDFTANPAEAEQGIAGVEWAEVPYLSVDAAEGAGRRRVRRNLMRRGQA